MFFSLHYFLRKPKNHAVQGDLIGDYQPILTFWSIINAKKYLEKSIDTSVAYILKYEKLCDIKFTSKCYCDLILCGITLLR